MGFKQENTVVSDKVDERYPLMNENQIEEPTGGTPFNDSEKPKSGRWCRIWQMRRKILAGTVLTSALLWLFIEIGFLIFSGKTTQEITIVLLCLGGPFSLWLIAYELKSILKNKKSYYYLPSIHVALVILIFIAPILSLLFNLTPEHPWDLDVVSSIILLGFFIELILCPYEFYAYFIRSKKSLNAFVFSFAYFIGVVILFLGIAFLLDSFMVEEYYDNGMGDPYHCIKFWNGYILSENTIFYSLAAITLILSTFWMNVFKAEGAGH